ncbi:MAG: glycosyltransferase [Catalinimonas sp.]
MKILFTGKSDFTYNRVQVLRRGLEKLADVELTLFPIGSRKSFDVEDFRAQQAEADFIYVPPFRHRDVGFVARHATRPLVFDPLVSKMLTKLDYGHFWKVPLKYPLDWAPFHRCDVLLADTAAHRDYFVRTFRVDPAKVFVLPVGVDTERFAPQPPPDDDATFRVGFYGTFVPLQGIEKIVEAARLLRDRADVRFEIIGSGHTYKRIRRRADGYKLDNLAFSGWSDYDALAERLRGYDLCLGIFGDSRKADWVVPNKLYHYAALGKCVVTKDTPGVREVFTDGRDARLCANDPAAIADAILEMKAHRGRRLAMGRAAQELMQEAYSEVATARRFVEILRRWRKTKS